jgi:hypothetical protein
VAPVYSFTCACGHTTDDIRPVADRDGSMPCEVCGKLALRDIQAEVRTSMRSGELPDFVSSSAGVHPDQVAEHNRKYGHLGVADAQGNIHIKHEPGRSTYFKYLKARGLHNRDEIRG